MSRVYFLSPTRTAELRGSERAWMRSLVEDLAVGVLGLDDAERVDRLISMASPDHYIAEFAGRRPGRMPAASAYRIAFLHDYSDDDPLIQHAGRRIDTFTLALNTALQVGSDEVKLAARLHGACELHTWVDGPNRAWLADIMQGGLDSGVFRRRMPYHGADGPEPGRWTSQGWDDVIALLRERDDEPVVTSFSITDDFPSSSVGDWMPPWPDGRAQRWDALTEEQQHERRALQDAWYDLEDSEQWRISMEGLRASPDGLEMTPDHWKAFRFEHRLTVLDLFAPDWQERLDRALTPEDGR
ncbi:hypothetical protein [Streptomyces antibioticus]|uniref:hypothetical protein n=1 Tax=Streptomyces antibioticus TaxID=1890 RepID=UPI0036C1E55A